jgi:hypothetical protein
MDTPMKRGRMSVSINNYLKTAFDFEIKALNTADPKAKSSYEKMAQTCRKVASGIERTVNSDAAELDLLAQRMVSQIKRVS